MPFISSVLKVSFCHETPSLLIINGTETRLSHNPSSNPVKKKKTDTQILGIKPTLFHLTQ